MNVKPKSFGCVDEKTNPYIWLTNGMTSNFQYSRFIDKIRNRSYVHSVPLNTITSILTQRSHLSYVKVVTNNKTKSIFYPKIPRKE